MPRRSLPCIHRFLLLIIQALRFFDRAITTYDEGLKRFPEAFDLAYNKYIISDTTSDWTNSCRARLEFSVTQHPKLVGHLNQPLLNLVKVALESHRYALGLQQENADLLLYVSPGGAC